MGKWQTYAINAEDQDGNTLLTAKHIQALSLESAWHKAVEEAIEACEPGTGSRPASMAVWRVGKASESHG